jgi:ferric-dicitrate binding protein FerR (iron transport regulator)
MSLGGLDALFNPAKRHMDDEKLRLQSTREEVGDASGGKRIDLDSGKVRIRKPGAAKAPAETSVAAAEPVEDAAADEPVDKDEDACIHVADVIE